MTRNVLATLGAIAAALAGYWLSGSLKMAFYAGLFCLVIFALLVLNTRERTRALPLLGVSLGVTVIPLALLYWPKVIGEPGAAP